MVDHLRSIAVTIEEPTPGAFHWVLLERGDDTPAWKALKASKEAFESYRGAMAAVLVELEGLIDDLDRGPRQAGEDEDSDPVGKPAAGPFGFGNLPS